MMVSNARRALLLVSALGAGCDPYTRSTVVAMRDPSQVAVQDADSMSRIPAGASGTEPVEVARTEVLAGPTSTSDLIVLATRRPDGSLVTEWQTRLPLVNGERHQLMTTTGLVTLDGHASIDTASPQVTIPVCGTLATHSVKGTLIGYNVLPATPCEGSHMVQINLETPQSNVGAVHLVSTNHWRGPGIFIATVSTLAFGGIGSLLAFATLRDKDGNVQPPAVRGVGVGLMAIGASIDIALLPALFAPDRDDVVFTKSPEK